MKTKLVAIGNSRGVRIPAALIEEAGLTDDVEIRVEGKSVVVCALPRRPREGWAEALAAMSKEELDVSADMLDFPNAFDETEWTWDEDE
jgi:antitoxin MazE